MGHWIARVHPSTDSSRRASSGDRISVTGSRACARAPTRRDARRRVTACGSLADAHHDSAPNSPAPAPGARGRRAPPAPPRPGAGGRRAAPAPTGNLPCPCGRSARRRTCRARAEDQGRRRRWSPVLALRVLRGGVRRATTGRWFGGAGARGLPWGVGLGTTGGGSGMNDCPTQAVWPHRAGPHRAGAPPRRAPPRRGPTAPASPAAPAPRRAAPRRRSRLARPRKNGPRSREPSVRREEAARAAKDLARRPVRRRARGRRGSSCGRPCCGAGHHA
jgi:hypothetical protein